MTGYQVIEVRPDTPDWLAARRESLGASDVPAILGLSPYSSPLDVYRAKFGVDRDVDPELMFIGHAEELTIGRWLRRFRPDLGVLRRGFMARSLEQPWLHASFDRFVVKRGLWVPVQMKTAHQYAGAEWAEEVPVAVQAQVQAELLVHGSDFGWAIGFVGGRRFHLHRIDRDEEFIRDLLIPQTRRFWEEHVQAQVPPEPSSTAEAVSLWPGGEDELVADDELLDLLEQLRTRQEALHRDEHDVEALKLEIQKRMQNAAVLLDPMGEVLATWKPRVGHSRIDAAALRADHPDLADAYTRRGEPTRVFIRKTPKAVLA